MTSRTSFRPVFFLLALAFAALSFSSCNRGYGCPNNFSIDTEMVQTLQHVTINRLK